MRRLYRSAILCALLLSACASQPAPLPSRAAPTATRSLAPGPATIEIRTNNMLGTFLIDDYGMALYIYVKDQPGSSICYAQCAEDWPPLLTIGDPIAGDGVDASMLGTTRRTDGGVQVTYNGRPLYSYTWDHRAGDFVGQGLGQVWYVLSPSGDEITLIP